jgi:drug/metabolite transporter (DMT)-like permease
MMDATVKWLGGSYPTRQIMFFRCVVAMIPVSIIIYTRGGIAQYMMTVSYRHTIIAIVAPLKYLSIVIGGVFAYFIWSKIPDLQGFIGIAIIVLSGLYTLHREVLYARRQNL